MSNLSRLVVGLLAVAACGDVVPMHMGDDVDASIDVDSDPVTPDGPEADAPDGDEPPPPVAVTVVPAGVGAGTIESTPAGITCPGTCTASFEVGTEISLTATPGTGALFGGWSGACAGTDPTCAFTASASATATAAFSVVTHQVTVSRTGDGTGSVTGSGIGCGSTCQVTVDHGTVISLAAAPAGGAVFAGWGGSCSGTGACSFTVTDDASVSAAFTNQSFTLLVARGGTGSGTVTSTPAGISCGTNCSETYTNGAVVNLTAAAAVGSTFTGWTGSGCSGTGTCSVTIGASNVVTATFALNRYALTVTPGGTGSGRVTSTPAGINCIAPCSVDFDHGTLVTLAAAPAVGSTFTGWTGACSGTGSCVVGMTSAQSVGVLFAAIPPNIMFVSAQTYAASALGGLSGADLKCQVEAQAAGLVGSGPGQNPTFRAWLSSSTVSAASRIGTSRGWVRPDGKPVIDLMSDLVTHRVYFPPRETAEGNLIAADENIHTNTRVDGTFSGTGPACTSPTTSGEYVGTTGGTVGGGNISAVSGMLTSFSGTACTTTRHLLCVGTGRTARVTPTPTTGRFAFTTANSWPIGGGLTGADAHCQGEATAAALPGTYKALLATSTRSAISRFDTTGAPWMRVTDQLRLTATAALMASTIRFTALDTAPNVAADGTTRFGNTGIWTGAPDLVTAGTTATTCNNWTSTTSTATSGSAGDTAIAQWFSGRTGEACTATFRKLVCLQE